MTSPPPGPGNSQGDVAERVRGFTPAEAPIGAMSGPPTTLDSRLAEAAMDHDIAPGNSKRRPPPPPWSSPREACVLIARGYTFRTGVVVASVVGTILSSVNEGTVIASGHLGVSTWARVAANYLVPFVVASVGYLAPFRRRRGTNR
ncbi:MAG: nitrate/nitrite transporter NrtS [Actinomycetota bacterium]|nr:nitrate/nitrite transporter NrtS [Actinomycetota bacterium]